MALTLTELQAVTDFYIDSTDNDIYFKSNVMLYKLLSRGKTIPGGKKIQAVLEYGKGNSGSYGANTKLPLGKKEIFNAAFFRWAAYFAGVTYDLEDARQNSGDLAIVNLVQGKLKNAQKSIRQDMGEDVYKVASDTDKLLGLGDMFNTDKAVQYGEIAENDMDMWAANVITTTEAIDFGVMQAIRRAASIDDNMAGKPDLYVTTEELKDAFEASLQVQARYSDTKLVDAGFENILFGSRPVVSDNKQTSGVIDALNLQFLDVETHQDFNFTKPVWASPIDQPDTKVAFIRWGGQLICRNRKAHARHTNLTAS